MRKHKIAWTEGTWNPTTGCTKISQGCKHCYAERMHKRLMAMGQAKYMLPFNNVQCHPDTLNVPYKRTKPTIYFVNSMSDLFHQDIELTFIQSVFGVMLSTPHHTYQILTKRSKRLTELAQYLPWPTNVWQGVSVENMDVAFRIDHLRETPAAIKFLSCEPLLGPLTLDLAGIDWVIVGGESGPGARLINPDWVREIRDNCLANDVPFFFKQWGGVQKKKAGRELDGQTWEQMPF